MSKQKKLSSINLSKEEETYFKGLVPLADRHTYNYKSYGTLKNPKHPNGYEFVGFEIKGYKTPNNIFDYFSLLTMYVYNNTELTQNKLKELIEKYKNSNSTVSSTDGIYLMKGNVATYSVYKKPNGEYEKIIQSKASRGRSIEDIYCIMKHRFKSLTFRKFYNLLINTIQFNKTHKNTQILMQYGYACSVIGKIRVSFSASYGIRNEKTNISDNGNSLDDISDHVAIVFYKDCLSKLDIKNTKNKNHEELKELFTKHYLHNTDNRRVLYHSNTKFDSKFTWLEMHNRFLDPSSKAIEVHSKKVILKYIR